MKRISRFFRIIENWPSVLAIKSGLIMVIPVLMIGSAALVFMYFPITQYQDFIENVFSGKLFSFFNFIYNATFGMFAVFLTCSISFSYARQREYKHVSLLPTITSLTCFFILSGVRIGDATWDALGVKGVFIAIISALVSTKMLFAILGRANQKIHGINEDTDIEFSYSVSSIIPVALVIGIVALVNIVIINLSGADSIFNLLVNIANAAFIPLGRSFISGILMVLISSVLWFFGIHGSNVLESVMAELFTPAIDINIKLVEAGSAPTEIFTKQFFDVFVLMGGCGTAICLLLSIAFFTRRRRNHRLARLAAVPMIFNINELMIFGYPVIFNTTLLVPFVLTPLFSFITTYIAMKTGLVPLTSAEVNWTAPVLLSGYIATGSVAGSALQLFNIVIGTFIYRPFVRIYDVRCEERAKRQITELVEMKKDSEEKLEQITLTKLTNRHGALARSLVSDLRYAISQNVIEMYYQPQYDNNYVCDGAESLMRWNHPLFGILYPPLVIQLARESGMLIELEKYVLKRSVDDAVAIREATGFAGKISVNISAATLQDDSYYQLLCELISGGKIEKGEICLEVTEQTALLLTDKTFERLQQIKDLGYKLAIDDFSMGHTSLAYLQKNCFDTVKLDGFLTTEMMNNERTYDIIKNITTLSRELGFGVIAEFVESEQQVKKLEAAGCVHYQGYFFDCAIQKDKFIERIRNEKKEKLNQFSDKK